MTENKSLLIDHWNSITCQDSSGHNDVFAMIDLQLLLCQSRGLRSTDAGKQVSQGSEDRALKSHQ